MAVTDIIYGMIRELMREDGTAEIKRNELAGKVGCVPSQINYVIASRFTPEQGYIVESRRGGGGYVRIRMIGGDGAAYRMHIVNSIGAYIDMNSAMSIIRNLMQNGALSEKECKLIAAALKSRCFLSMQPEDAAQVRAELLKNMLMAV